MQLHREQNLLIGENDNIFSVGSVKKYLIIYKLNKKSA